MFSEMVSYCLDFSGKPTARAIDFSDVSEMVCGCANAYLAYDAIRKTGIASKRCKALTVFTLRGHRSGREPMLCSCCGWWTGHQIMLEDAECEECGECGYCMDCLRVQGGRILCCRCPEDGWPGMSSSNRALVTAWRVSCDLNDAIRGRGHFYPFFRVTWHDEHEHYYGRILLQYVLRAWRNFSKGFLKYPYSLLW